jgi:predicted phage-related endonuclease
MTEVDLESVRGAVELLRYCAGPSERKIKEVEDNAKAAVQDAMGDADVGLLDGEPAIQWPTFKENRFDSAAFRADHAELWEQYKAVNEKRRFDVV